VYTVDICISCHKMAMRLYAKLLWMLIMTVKGRIIHRSQCIPISTKTRLMKALVWPVETYGCENWALRKNEEKCLGSFEMMKGLRKILRVSWTAKKTNEWVLNKAEVKRELLDTVKARKLAYCGHIMRKQGSCPEKEIM